jgi:hypothetical protein
VEVVRQITNVALQVPDKKGNTIIDYATRFKRMETVARYLDKMEPKKRPRCTLESP